MVLTRHEPSRTYPAKFSPKFAISASSTTQDKPSVEDVGAAVVSRSLSTDSKTFVQRARQEMGE
jgi:hypothetical protein